MENFWSTYWPVALVLFAGVILGVPISLWIEKKRQSNLDRTRGSKKIL
jgi:ABC-type nitrate/sulfonate/bicarbonate transport system permease component